MTNFPPRVFSLDYLTINIREIRSAETSEIHKKQSITSQKTRSFFYGQRSRRYIHVLGMADLYNMSYL